MEKKIRDRLLEDDTILFETVEKIYNWYGELDYLIWEENSSEILFLITIHDLMGLAEAVSEGYYNSTDEFVRLDIYETLESASFEDVIEEMKDYIDDIVDVILNKEELLEELLETLNISLDNKRESNKTYSVRELNRKNLYTKD